MDIGAFKEVLDGRKLCKACIERLVPKRWRRFLEETNPEDCWLCEGLSKEIDEFARLVEKKLKGYEFSTFLIGSKIDGEIVEKEEDITRKAGIKRYIDIKTWVNREVEKILSRKLGKSVSYENPDITAIIDTRFNHVTLQVSPLYIYGRYIKKVRGIPQTKWPCRICKGIGCRRCNFTGKTYQTSVEEIIAEKVLEATGGESESFHGCGREDIDARMLGEGRPFVLEIKNPKIRNIDLGELEREINAFAQGKVEVRDLRFSNKEEVVRLKKATFPKVYHAKIIAEKEIPEEKLKEVVDSLRGITIKQFTPSRVAHRRALKTREKRIMECKVMEVKGKEALIEILAESGTYIKEFVSGDEGRTKPSLSELLGIPCKVEALDVVAVRGE